MSYIKYGDIYFSHINSLNRAFYLSIYIFYKFMSEKIHKNAKTSFPCGDQKYRIKLIHYRHHMDFIEHEKREEILNLSCSFSIFQ